MALPLKKDDVASPQNFGRDDAASENAALDNPGPKIIPMPMVNVDAADLDDAVVEEVEFVLRRAGEACDKEHPIHELGERVADVFDQTLQEAASTSRRGIQKLADQSQRAPFRFIAAVAVVAFVVGFGLRLWRSSRA